MSEEERVIRLMLKGIKARAKQLGIGDYHLALRQSTLLELQLEILLKDRIPRNQFAKRMLVLHQEVEALAQNFLARRLEGS